MPTKDLLVSALVAAGVAAGTTYAIGRVSLLRPAEDVPPLVGLKVDEARASLDPRGLLLAVSQQREDPSMEPGQIVEQRPLEGSRIYRGESVAVVIARAVEKVEVPALVGQPAGEARRRLEAARLAVGRTSEDTSDRIPAGSVVAQSLTPRAEARAGTAVDLVVSRGPETSPVPSVLGRSLKRAREQLTRAGFTVGNVRYQINEDLDEGVVLQQIPAAEQPAARGLAVELVVNRFE